MAKGKSNTKKRRLRKKHNSQNFMPAIQSNPTLHEDNIEKLPKIFMDCKAKLNDRDINT